MPIQLDKNARFPEKDAPIFVKPDSRRRRHGATWPPSGACFLNRVEGAGFAWDVSPGLMGAPVDSGSARARGQVGSMVSVRKVRRGSRARA